ncbi:unnamed protein product [Lymnaea stagnalis]|uniref:Uncharacterized protein n=1 Tax=Lymnaea stagnalis TaxID=6523 RepID=A0AAV2I886_LYMST
MQFGIQPNCEKYRQNGESEDYTYWADPGGPELENDLPPFLVECKFIANPPQGITIVHHTNSGVTSTLEPVRYIHYISASEAQIESLKVRSTLCTQEISIDCKQVNIQDSEGTIQFTSPNGTIQDLNKFLLTCGTDGNSCNCNGLGPGSDRGLLSDLESLPIKSLVFSKISEQLHGNKELSVSVGPMVCAEIFPTCAELQAFLNSKKIAMGESKSVQSGLYTVDPDGLGGVDPMSVKCVLQSTTVYITPSISSVTTDPNNPYEPVDKCFDITYTDGMGNPISAAQITALVKKSDKCKQDLSLDCKNAPFTNNVNYTSCDGIHQRGWAGSFKSEKCACGVNGNCDGGPLESCNCDMNDNVARSDSGTIINTDSLPVCQICFHIDPKPGTSGSAPPVSLLKYTLGELVCDGGQGTKRTCQNARIDYSTILKSNLERSVASTDEQPSPYGCKFVPKPPIGILTVKAETPLITSNDTSTINITITYISINITLIRQTMQQNEYCTQAIYLFCASAETLQLGGQYGWYSYGGDVSHEWRALPDTSDEVKKICTDNHDLCTKCGNPKGFVITQQEKLPVARLKLAGSGATVIIGDVECFDLKKSCQEILDTNSRSTGLVRGNVYVLDVDGSGPLKPFTANCELDDANKNGVTEIPVTGNLTGTVHITDKDGSTNFELPITYEGVTHEQIHGLALISNFCWQGLKYECKYSPIQKSNPASTYLNLYQGKERGFGTGENSSFPGCACAQTGTCLAGYSCNCDALEKFAVDQGFVTDTAKMPITSIGVGGQVKELSGSADIHVTNVRCSSKPIDPPRDCDDAFKKRSQFGITYSNNSEYLISPNPELNGVKPFLVYCDFKLSPGNGVTIIKPNLPPKTPVAHTPDVPNEILYYGPSDEQILALISRSAYCYQGVRYDCYASTFLNEGNYWLSVGSNEKRQFWGGGEQSADGRGGVCACGKAQTCGGLDSATAQRARRCNCDAGDNTFRSDAGIIDIKGFLPVSKFLFGRYSKFQTVNLTLGDLMCSQKPLKFNECVLGFSDCHPNAECVDEENGYRCVCKPGWNSKYLPLSSENPRANGRECIDDDECAGHLCPYSAVCTNTPGDFYCTCKPGYKQTGKTTCEDINECADSSLNDCDPHARCENLDGSFRCVCQRDYRGDGITCIPVGQCSCFGDPHCSSYDRRWLHFQGKCDYVMSQDGCQEGQVPTFKVVVKHWQKDNEKPGNYSWIKEVIIHIFNLEIRLEQNNRILVDGSVVRQYFDEHRLSVMTYNNRVKVQTVIGLEIVWDGKDAVELVVPELSAGQKLCGLCGNFNGDSADDWELGPACSEGRGQQTGNPDLFGHSWTSLSHLTPTCAYDCKPHVPLQPVCDHPNALYEKECDALFNINTSPFKACLLVKKPGDLEEFRKSCVFDLCHAENLDEVICRFAEILGHDCANNEKVEVKYKDKLRACKPPPCTNNMIYKECGTAAQDTCISRSVNKALETLSDTQACQEGCFCPDGLVLDGDKCVTPEDCGCFYRNSYLAKNDELTLPDCSLRVICHGSNATSVHDVQCKENEACRNEDGVTGCYCKEGYVMKDGRCQPDICFGVKCEDPNMNCINGTCVCKEGSQGDCQKCYDIDECATGLDNCTRIGQTCNNIFGSFKCGCQKGFTVSGQYCKDIDECEYGIDSCGEHSECVNTPGSFLCECCAGYVKDANNNCVRDTSTATAPGGKCCACQGEKCAESGKVCGSDGNTYSNYRSLSISGCKAGNDELKVDYDGACQGSCATVICDKQYSSCSMVNGKPSCSCPTCEDSRVYSAFHSTETVCATNKVTYTSVCHMKKATCEADIETTVEVEFQGKPCIGKGGPLAGPWSDWGDCSEKCKQGTRNRTREVYVANDENTNIHNIEFIPCYSTCPNGPCRADTCEAPGQVCVADDSNNPSCQCPICDSFEDKPVCGRVREVIKTYENECELEKKICELKTNDYEVLEPRACEEKPVNCSVVRQYRVETDSNGCKADRSINFGACYGGCDKEAELCCFAKELGQASAILYCPDGSNFEKSYDVIVGCSCITKEEVQTLSGAVQEATQSVNIEN